MFARRAFATLLVSLSLTPVAAATETVIPVAHTHLVAAPVVAGARIASATAWTPQQLATAYGISWSTASGSQQTIAIVDAYDASKAESDLAAFSSQYGLPGCTTANGCFKKVNQHGATSPLPAADGGWAMEINLDVQWAHAIAPGAKILLIEANSASFSDLVAAEQYANTTSTAKYISNSWGAGEFGGETAYDHYFTPAAGKTIFVSAGDNGLPAEYPSASPNVVSVGGTNLVISGTTKKETVWSGGGGGCSRYENATTTQKNFSQYGQTHCNGKRSTPDLSALADPATGVRVYFTQAGHTTGAWYQVGGTSLASPMVAALTADAKIALTPAKIYGTALQWRDANAAAGKPTNGATCLTGYDLCTGRGAPTHWS
jgi:subtilase family serine protease